MKNNIYEFYKKNYELDKLKDKISNKKILFLIYDDDFYYYLNDNKFIEANDNINILNYIKFLNKQYKVKIINFYPVCFCGKTLVIALRTDNMKSSYLKIVKYDNINRKYKELILYHKLNFTTLFLSSSIKKEILMGKKYIRRYRFHEKVIKKYFLTEKKRRKKEFNNLLKNLIPLKESIIDVSCGDNSDIFNIALNKNYKTIVGNDICLEYLNTQKKEGIIYTNDNIEMNKIKENSYDVSFCKNTLHHMSNITNIDKALKFLYKISKEIIIVEILNPNDFKGLPRFLNKYLYTKFLKDVGNCYLNEEQLRKIINNIFDKNDISYQKFTNILGTYLIIKINKENKKSEN